MHRSFRYQTGLASSPERSFAERIYRKSRFSNLPITISSLDYQISINFQMLSNISDILVILQDERMQKNTRYLANDTRLEIFLDFDFYVPFGLKRTLEKEEMNQIICI